MEIPLTLLKNTKAFSEVIQLVSSKSETNRALIINALMDFKADLSNISTARDSQTMLRLLKEQNEIADVLDAGTTMRFLTAFFTITGQNKIMTGTPRMCERPIGILTEALISLGGKIEFLDKKGYPPLKIKGFEYSGNNKISINGNVSSQYISALLMIAPLLPNGVIIDLLGEVGSKPYIEMTIAQMRFFGAKVELDWGYNRIKVENGKYSAQNYTIESDWSGASYWYSMVALGAEGASVKLLGLKENSLQGDSVIVDLMLEMGVKSTFEKDGFLLTKIPHHSEVKIDFSNCPDLAQTITVICAAKGIKGYFTGLESLKIKETDRIFALQTELAKIGASFIEVQPQIYELRPSDSFNNFHEIEVYTYDDHRMAMAFAPLANLMNVKIDDGNVVKKSYPSFWEDFSKIFVIEQAQI